MKAFENFPEIQKLKTDEEKHRAWLKDYEGLYFSIGENGEDMIQWSKEKESYVYEDDLFDKSFLCKDERFREKSINKIQRHPKRIIVEFDDDKITNGKSIKKFKKICQEQKWGFIETTHKGNCNYIHLEFNREISDEEAKSFLEYVKKLTKAKVDTGLWTSKKRYPVVFAKHWKHGNRELPVDFFEGEQIDYDVLGIGQKKEKDNSYKKLNREIEEKAEIKFDFESDDIDIKNLEELEMIIKENFPSIWFETKACLSVFGCMSLKHLNGCPSLNLVGNPSGEKTTCTSFFYNHDLTYVSDDFTPKAFVSHSANVKADDLEGVDLLPKIKNKILISPELAPLFEAPKEKLLENFSILTRVLDGEGLNRDSGVHGHRGYSGDYKFGWIGATTPIKASVWNVMGKIGNRLFFLNMREKNREQKDYTEMFRGKAYEEKVKHCRGAVKNFLDRQFQKFPVRSLEWDAEQDIFILQEIVKYAQLLAKLRGTLMLWKSEGGDYQYNFPLVEEPPRAINSLFNLAKGHALIHGRTFLRSEDLEIVRAVAFSSMPHDRFEFLKLLIKHEGKLTTENLQKELNCSDDTARRTMKLFEVLGVVSIKTLQIDSFGSGRPMQYVEIKPDFLEIIKETQVLNLEENLKTQRYGGVYDDFSVKKFVEDQKISEKNGHTHPSNDELYDKPHEINPVSSENYMLNEKKGTFQYENNPVRDEKNKKKFKTELKAYPMKNE